MKNYRITPALEIIQNHETILLNHSFKGITLEYHDSIILDILHDFNLLNTKEELYEKYRNEKEILDECFKYEVFEKNNCFIKNMNDESVYRILIFNEIHNSNLYKIMNIIIQYLSFPLMFISLFYARNKIFDLINHFQLSYLIPFLFLFLPFCFLHELGHCISAIANNSKVYDLDFYYKGIIFGFFGYFDQSNTKKGNIQICLGGVKLCVLICSVLLLVGKLMNQPCLIFISVLYIFINIFNLSCFQGFDGYLCLCFYFDIDSEKLLDIKKHPNKYNKKEYLIGCSFVLCKLLSIIYILMFYGFCLMCSFNGY